jgi:RNA polymerase primary sigma factor
MRAVADVGSNESTVISRSPVRTVRVSGLTPSQIERLERIYAETPFYVDHASFRRASTEKALFHNIERDALMTRRWCNVVVDDLDRQTRVKAAVLTAEEERRVFLRFNYARCRMARIRRACGRRLSRKAALELLKWFDRSEAAKNLIVQANMPLVLAMAKRARLSAVDYAELISEGNMALLRSVEKFDCGRGFKFSTYSCRAILKSFSRVAMRSSRYRGHFPTEFDPTLEKSDYIEHCRVAAESDCVYELRTIMDRNIASLNDVERTVIIERFALTATPDGDSPIMPKTLEEVGNIIGVTKERVRQIQNRALAKLKTALEDGFLAA